MITKLPALFVLLSLIVCDLASSQTEIEPGNRIAPLAQIAVKPHDDSYVYQYSLANGRSAQQQIVHFFIISPVSAKTFDVHSPSNWRSVSFEDDGLTLKWLARPKRMVDGYIQPIFPDEVKSGFSFRSPNMPGIVIYYAEGDHPLPSFPEGMATDSIPGYTDLTPYGPGVIGMTIGPAILPNSITAASYLDTLLSYTRQSADLGWLAPLHSNRKIDWDDDCDNDEHPQDGIASNFDRRLRMANRELEKGDSVQARKSLETLLQKVERVWKRSQDEDKRNDHKRNEKFRSKDARIIMTSEAYALLKYNLEYLIDRLPEKVKRDKGFRGEERK